MNAYHAFWKAVLMTIRPVVFVLAATLVFAATSSGAATGDPPGAGEPGAGVPAPATAESQETQKPAAGESSPPQKLDETDALLRLDEITITATRTERRDFNTPKPVTIVTQRELFRENQPVALDSLADKAGIWLEKRTMSTSDLVMRGFSGGNILALVDGCTLTTLWGEGGFAGDDMYGKVEAESIERIEVVRGPSAVLYGSNALGGVINFITKSCPLDYTEAGWDAGGRLKAAYASASQMYMARGELWTATPDFKFFVGGTSRNFDDTEGGRGVGTMEPTGAREYNWDTKIEYRLAENQELTLAYQDVYRHKTHRYYRPTQQNFNSREAVTLDWDIREISDFFTSMNVKGYYQDKLDERKDFTNQRTGEARTETYSGDIQAVSLAGDDHRLTYGVHYHEDHGESPGDEEFTWTDWNTGAKRKDAPDSVWNNLGTYIQDEWDMAERWSLVGSFRYDTFRFDSDVDQYWQPGGAGADPTDDDFSDNEYALSGGLGLVYHLTQDVNLIASYSQGFRLFPPKFSLTQHGYGVLAPHELLDPIYNRTTEVGAKVRLEKFAASCFTYYSSIKNWQTIVPGTYEGQNFYDYDGDGIDSGDRVYVTETGRANVYGVELETETRLDLLRDDWRNWVFAAGFTWNYGNDYANDSPLRHTQPAAGLFALRWNEPDPVRAAWFEIGANVVRHYDRIPQDRWDNDVGYLNDPQDPTSGKIRSDEELPGYTAYNIRGGLNLAKNLGLTLAVENFTDKKYRRAHSRWTSEPGINFLASLTYTF